MKNILKEWAAATGHAANGTAKPVRTRTEIRHPARASRLRPADIPGSGKITVRFYEQKTFRLRLLEERSPGGSPVA
jgi:hypothetical protein